ncbi:MAG: Na+/H+ antiporter subunit E [Myxococcota bacterium]
MTVLQALLWNVVLMMVWCAAHGSWSLASLLTGLLGGYLVLWVLQPILGPPLRGNKVRQLLGLAWFLAVELVRSTLAVARDVVAVRYPPHPGVVAIRLDARTDTEITLLSWMITLTPGTLTLHLARDRSALFIHALSVSDRDALEEHIKRNFERRVLELLR